MRRALHVAVVPGSDVLTVSFTAEDPALAAAAANLAMRLYLDHERQESYARFSDAQSWLQEHAAQVQAGLDETETELAKARAAAGVVQGAQASLTTETASRLAASLVQAQAGLAMNQARLKAAARDAAAIAPSLELLRKEQADLAAQVGALQDVYGADYPDLRTDESATRGDHRADRRRDRACAGCRARRCRGRPGRDRHPAKSLGGHARAVAVRGCGVRPRSAPWSNAPRRGRRCCVRSRCKRTSWRRTSR